MILAMILTVYYSSGTVLVRPIIVVAKIGGGGRRTKVRKQDSMCLCVCVSVFFPFILDIKLGFNTYSSRLMIKLDVRAVVL